MSDSNYCTTAWYQQKSYDGIPLPPVHERLFEHVKQLEEDQQEIYYQNVLNTRLYTNREPMAFAWNEDVSFNFRPLSANVENIIQSVVDTLRSRISQQRSKATIIPRGADFTTYMRARKLDKFLWGEFTRFDIPEKVVDMSVDAMVNHTGFLKIDNEDGDVFVERVDPSEIVVDQRECVSDELPLQFHHRKLINRLWLQDKYKNDKKMLALINEAQTKNFVYSSYRNPSENYLVVIESWKRPTRPGAGDGRHTICIENCTLLDEEYTRDCFPFVWLKYGKPKFGFFGRALVSDLLGYQIRLNDLNELIQMGQDLMCVPRILIEQGSGIVKSQFDNSLGKLHEFRGIKPEAMIWGAFNAEIYNERDRIRQAAFEFAGVSQMSAQNKMPSQWRADSSDALREATAIEDDRLSFFTQAVEKVNKEIAEQLIYQNAQVHKAKKVSRKTTYRSGDLAEEIDWEDVDMPRDKYVLEIGASSVVNMTPAARKDQLNEWLAREIITLEEYKAKSGMPDLEDTAQSLAAHTAYIEKTIEHLLSGEKVVVPEPLMNLPEAFNRVHATYAHLQSLDMEEYDEVIDRFVDWLESAQEMLNPEPTEAELMAQQAGAIPPDPMAAGPMPADPGVAPPMDPMMAGGMVQ